MQYALLIGTVLDELLALAGSATSGQTQNIINMLDKFIELAIAGVPELLQPISNIISALSGSGKVSADQISQLQAQAAKVDDALDAAAEADGLS